MTQQNCSVCDLSIEHGQLYLGFIPGGYGPIKDKPLKVQVPGIMHVYHLSTSDYMRLDKQFVRA